jgi:hypothetical protein
LSACDGLIWVASWNWVGAGGQNRLCRWTVHRLSSRAVTGT